MEHEPGEEKQTDVMQPNKGGVKMKRRYVVAMICTVLMIAASCSDTQMTPKEMKYEQKTEALLDDLGYENGRFQLIAGTLGVPLVLDTKKGYLWRGYIDSETKQMSGMMLIRFEEKFESAVHALESRRKRKEDTQQLSSPEKHMTRDQGGKD